MVNLKLTYRKAQKEDLENLVALLKDDESGGKREKFNKENQPKYLEAFKKIDKDPNQYLMIVENENETIATCHLTFLPSLTFVGSTRMQIEAVRVASKHRGKKISYIPHNP